MQEISMGGSGGSPRHRKPAVEAWFIFFELILADFGLARLDFGLTEPPNPKKYIPEVEK